MIIRVQIILLAFFITLEGRCNYYIASQLTYQLQSGNCGGGSNYEINLKVYTHNDSLFTLDSALIFFGDGQYGYANKIDSIDLCGGIREFHYSINHLYLICSTYNITFVDSSFVKQAKNYPNTQNNFYGVRSVISGSPFFNDQFSAITYSNDLVTKALINQEFRYNLSFYDPDGDSLSYQLDSIDSPPDYWVPNGVTINPLSGEIVWVNPDTIGVFDFYVGVSSYKNGIYTGEIMVNFMVIVDSTLQLGGFNYTENWNSVGGFYEYHLNPSQNLQLFFEYLEPGSDSVDVYSYSELYLIANSANFNVIPNGNSKFGLFNWTPGLSDLRNNPYVVTFSGVSYTDTLCLRNVITAMIYVDNNVGISDENLDENLNVFPNPTLGEVIIKSESKIKASVIVYNSCGQIVLSDNTYLPAHLNISEFSPGIYFIRISDENSTWVSKIVKQ